MISSNGVTQFIRFSPSEFSFGVTFDTESALKKPLKRVQELKRRLLLIYRAIVLTLRCLFRSRCFFLVMVTTLDGLLTIRSAFRRKVDGNAPVPTLQRISPVRLLRIYFQ